MTNKLAKLILVVVVSGLLLAACGSDSEDVASLESIEDAQGAEPTPGAALDNEARMMAFTQCLRAQGVEVYDPVVDAEGNIGKPEFVEGVDSKSKEFGEAWEACDHHLEGFTSEKESVDVSETVDQGVALATCLREKGYDVDEPTAETLDQWGADFKEAIDWDDPAAVAD